LFAQVEGDVMGEGDKGIANAMIRASDSLGKLVDTASTDNRGFYNFRRLKPGRYNITAQAAGYIPSGIIEVKVEKEYNRANDWDDIYYAVRVNIRLKPDKSKK